MGVRQYQTKQGRRYQAHLYLRGKRVATKAGFLTKKEAKKWLIDEENRRKDQADLEASMDFFSLAESYLDYSSTQHKNNTFIYKKGVLKKFIQFLGDECEEVTRQHVKDFLLHTKENISAKAANKYRVELVSLFNWAISEDYIEYNPALHIKRFSETKFIPYIPPAEDLKAVIEVANDWQKDFIRLLLHTAARQNELLNLTWEDVSFNNRTITLWTSKRREGNKESRVLDMTEESREILLRRKEEKSSNYVFTNPHTNDKFNRQSSAIKNMFIDLCKTAKVRHFSAHSIRHFVASNLVEHKHIDVRTVQKLLGHMNISTTEKYLQEMKVDRSATETLNSIAKL